MSGASCITWDRLTYGARANRSVSRPAVTRGSQGVDPAVEAASRPGQDAGITQGVGEQCAAFVGGEQIEGKIVCVAAAQRLELLLRPFDREAHQVSYGEVRRLDALAEFRAETAQRATVLGHYLALGGELPDEGLQ